MKNGIDYATKAGMYVILDWHVHNYNPNDTKDAAITFLSQIAQEYASYDNILYEICNEPTNSPWSSAIKPYAQEVIPAIRKYAPDSVIIVGTNTWSQDVEEALADPLSPESYGNIMYTFHFYANSHTTSYRSRVERAIKGGLPLFITEFGTCDASGNEGFNSGESEKWFELCKNYSISHMNWSLSNKNETASAILSSCSKTSGWSDEELSESGQLVKSHFIKDCKR
ncbi:MAG: glycoside hydrolase family 5 protein [Treponema sp.]|nr:glycoside hydrolase family 5 protein [Treponema sp.]